MKTIVFNSIYLKGGSYFITQNSNDAYRVLNGKIFVYIVPIEKGEVGRRTLLCEVSENEIIPAFAYKDMDCQLWRFCFVASDKANIECLPDMCTNPLKEKFFNNYQIPDLEKEGFNNALVNYYRKCLVQEDAYIMRTSKEKQLTKYNTNKLISSLFQKNEFQEYQDGSQALYKVMSVLCHKSRIDIAPFEVIKECCGKDPSVFDIARISHFPCREIILEENWHNSDAGGLIVYVGKDKEPAVCVPKGQHHYILYRSGKNPERLTRKLAEQCSPKAYMVYRPFPQKEITKRDFFQFCLKGLNKLDILLITILTIVSSLIGLLIPTLNQKLYDEYILMGQESMVVQIGIIILSFMIGNIIFSVLSSVCKFRLSSKIQYQVQNGVYYRIFELPEHFFRKYESADLARRVEELGKLAGDITTLCITLFFSLVTAIFYLWRMFSYSILLSFVSIGISILFSLVIYILARYQMRYEKTVMELDGKSSSALFQFILGIDKIRISGIEDRVIYEYMKPFVKQRCEETKIGKNSNIIGVITSVDNYITTLVLYFITYKLVNISMGIFVAFVSSYGYISKMIQELTNGLVSYKKLQPAYERVNNILNTAPETNKNKHLPSELKGNIDINHLTFSYNKETLNVFEDLSLEFQEGDYIGIVGSSGCGKSTLLKLLLGFENPTSGKIYYDNQDMSELNLQELRKKFGVVLQDGELISGSIFENITLTAPWAGYKEVQKVIEDVGLTEDIDNMSMGLQTIVSENCNTISGGQKQRILIARAIINNPKIIFFDEATSALDNITQSMVCKALEKMNSTRIVIAHRLSTIKNCNRIIVLNDGKIVEEGDYQTLMSLKGLFYQLASRQIID